MGVFGINWGKVFTPRGSSAVKEAANKEAALADESKKRADEWWNATSGLRSTLLNTLGDKSNFATTDLSKFSLKKPAMTDWTKAFTNPTQQTALPYVSMGGLEAFTAPDYQTIGSNVRGAYNTIRDINLPQYTQAKEGQINQERARMGQNPLTLPNTAYTTWKTQKGAEMGAEGELAALEAERQARQQTAEFASQKLGFERQNQIDNLDRMFKQYELDSGFREEVNNNIMKAAQLAQADIALSNAATSTEAGTKLAGDQARNQALTAYLSLLNGTSSPEAFSAIMSNLANMYGSATDTYTQIMKQNQAMIEPFMNAAGAWVGRQTFATTPKS